MQGPIFMVFYIAGLSSFDTLSQKKKAVLTQNDVAQLFSKLFSWQVIDSHIGLSLTPL